MAASWPRLPPEFSILYAMKSTLSPPLQGQVAAVTGAASGIGFASARAMVDAGARVVLVDRDRTDVRKGDRVVVRTTTGETMAKEVAALTARSVTLASINPAYEPRVISRQDIDWMARILWVSQ